MEKEEKNFTINVPEPKFKEKGGGSHNSYILPTILFCGTAIIIAIAHLIVSTSKEKNITQTQKIEISLTGSGETPRTEEIAYKINSDIFDITTNEEGKDGIKEITNSAACP